LPPVLLQDTWKSAEVQWSLPTSSFCRKAISSPFRTKDFLLWKWKISTRFRRFGSLEGKAGRKRRHACMTFLPTGSISRNFLIMSGESFPKMCCAKTGRNYSGLEIHRENMDSEM